MKMHNQTLLKVFKSLKDFLQLVGNSACLKPKHLYSPSKLEKGLHVHALLGQLKLSETSQVEPGLIWSRIRRTCDYSDLMHN